MHWVGWGSIALLAVACLAPWMAATGEFGLLRGGEFVLAFAVAAAAGLLVRKRALTTMGGLGALTLIAAVTLGSGAGLTAGVFIAAIGALGLVFMPWPLRNPWA